ncbi:MAG TPA: UDP-N-acetylmuramoyl-tripeptide--D-alanyl-D-alanine ligase [Lachnospiraceae bacterium]|mgnify:CR=1 FL=1|nr:UDP-N-acetylmuramoyl-tripeptide--D-alanyl-D-alanine ligase [Lachnospiraceae bacterium]
MDIIAIAVAVLVLPIYYLVLRYNLHMFQLNGYKNGEHVTWMKKNHRKQLILWALLLIGVAGLFFPNLIVWIAAVVLLLICGRYYLYLKKTNQKKKLVLTNRVKRQIITDLLLTAIGAVLGVLFYSNLILPAILLIMTACQGWLLLLVNLLNRPAEMLVNQHFINDAKRKLLEVEGLKIIGVTGSYGKTSVKYYLQTLLQGHYNVLITPESYNTPMGVVKTIRESLKSTHEIFVCEMGARHVGDIREICDIVHPHHGIITSIGPQHLETFFNMDNIINTKFELADALPSEGLLFLNGDNEYISGHCDPYPNQIFYRSTSNGEGYSASGIKLSQMGTEFVVNAPNGESESFQMRLVGAHNVINVVGAIAVANTLGIPLKELKVPVRRIQPVAHRLQMLERGNVTIIDDAYNSNPVGSKAAVETLKMFDGLRILVTPGMVELGEKEAEYNHKFGTYAASCCDYVLLIGKEHTKPIYEGLMEKGYSKERCLTYDTLEEALAYAYTIKEDGHKFILLENDLPDNY